MHDRVFLGSLIAQRLRSEVEKARNSFHSSGEISHFVVENVLPAEVPYTAYEKFPEGTSMKLTDTIREFKHYSAQMDAHAPLLEDLIFAFQQPEVVAAISDIVGKDDLHPDENLYAGGLFRMERGHHLSPHLDNSHDKDRRYWRNLNLLYYVTPDWPMDKGGNLELWPDGPRGRPITVHSRFNRLVVMETHDGAWHSVSPNTHSRHRCCLSNFYFSPTPMRAEDKFHVSTFRGRPEQPVKDLVLRMDTAARSAVRRLFPLGIVENRHKYIK